VVLAEKVLMLAGRVLCVAVSLVAADVGVLPDTGVSPRNLADSWDYESGPWRINDCQGEQQSPVNIAPHTISGHRKGNKKVADFINYNSLSGLEVKNTGHGIQVDGAFGTFTLNNEVYRVLQFHYHFPSEHAVDGELTAGCIHIVHQKQGATGLNDLLVVGVLLVEGQESRFLSKNGFGDLPLQGSRPLSDPLDLNDFSTLYNGHFYHYMGSLTTPPCTQTVHWNVLATTASVSAAQVASFKALFPDPANNRPLQPLNGRFLWQDNPYCICPTPSYSGDDMGGGGGGYRRLAKAGDWDYKSPWNMDYCDGDQQSPIGISPGYIASERVGSTHVSDYINYRPLGGLMIKRLKYGVQVDGSFGTFTMESEVYNAVQFHFHFPSEHAIDGMLYAGELHIVHQKQGASGLDDLLVVGIMLEVGSENSFLAQLGWSNMPEMNSPREIPGNLDLNDFEDSYMGDFYHYMGSLTTPPCDETVHWNVLAVPAQVSQAQVDSFKQNWPNPGTNRPLQSLNGRLLWKNNPYCVCERPLYSGNYGPNKAVEKMESASTEETQEGLEAGGVIGIVFLCISVVGMIVVVFCGSKMYGSGAQKPMQRRSADRDMADQYGNEYEEEEKPAPMRQQSRQQSQRNMQKQQPAKDDKLYLRV